MLDSQSLLNSGLQRLFLIIILCIIFSINLFIRYQNYLEFKKEIFYETTAVIVNIYQKEKEDNNLLRLKTDDFTVFTSTNKSQLAQNDTIKISLITSDRSFFDYLKRFLTKNFSIEKIQTETKPISAYLSEVISSQHQNQTTSKTLHHS